jgi:hypothetical protein
MHGFSKVFHASDERKFSGASISVLSGSDADADEKTGRAVVHPGFIVSSAIVIGLSWHPAFDQPCPVSGKRFDFPEANQR